MALNEAVEAFDGGEPGLPIRRSTIRLFAVDQFQFSEADEIAHWSAPSAAHWRASVVLAQKGRQLRPQQLRRIGHDEPPPNRLI